MKRMTETPLARSIPPHALHRRARPRPPRAGARWAAVACIGAAIVVLGAVSASAQEARALVGDLAPGAGGATYSSFDGLSINASGAVAFQAYLAGGTAGVGLFLETETTSEAIVLAGDPLPAPGTGTFEVPYGPALTDAGDVFFSSTLSTNPGLTGLFRYRLGVIEVIALPGDPAPGSGGGTFSTLPGWPAANAAGEVAFFGGIVNGNRISGLFRYSGGTISPIVFRGDSAPGSLPGNVSFIFTTGLSMNEVGDVSFPATLYDSTFPATSYDVAFVYSGGVLDAAAIAGDVPNGGDGTAYALVRKETTSIADGGDVAFAGTLDSGSGSLGIFVDRVGQPGDTVAFVGDLAPGTGGGTIVNLRYPAINASGQVVYEADMLGGTANGGIFTVAGGVATAVAVEGEVAPGTAGGVYANFDGPAAINDSGVVAFEGLMLGGSVDRGVFVVPEPGLTMSLAIGGFGMAWARKRPRPRYARDAARREGAGASRDAIGVARRDA